MAQPQRIDVVNLGSIALPAGLYRIAGGSVLPADTVLLPEMEPSLLAGCEASDVDRVASPGDIVLLTSRGSLRVLLSHRATSNTLLVTERCDNRCVFCSQPPKDLDDGHLYEDVALALLNYQSSPGEFVGLSGGEPTYDRERFLRLLRLLAEQRPGLALHILTNGRVFSDPQMAQEIVEASTALDIVWGVPLYGVTSDVHDRAVGCAGAFRDTVAGLRALGELRQCVELRIVPTQINLHHLPLVAAAIGSVVPIPDQVSIMQLEPKGWARKNYDSLFVSSASQAAQLRRAIKKLTRRGVSVSLFNYPLCQVPEDLRRYCVSSISDWKNYYPLECDSCSQKPRCGGFFTSAASKYLEPVNPIC